jgi:hypothetical protein
MSWRRTASLPLEDRDPHHTILILFNHGYAADKATTYKAVFPPILQMVADRNADVVLFAQVRNMATRQRDDHRRLIEAAIAWFHRTNRILVENIILAGQSCGGWESLQAAAFTHLPRNWRRDRVRTDLPWESRPAIIVGGHAALSGN